MKLPLNERTRHDALFLMQQSPIAWKNMWLILFVGIILTAYINPAAFRVVFYLSGLITYIICVLVSTYPLRQKSTLENIITIWYFRFFSELLFMFLVITYTGREKSVMIICIGAMLLRFILCRPYLKEVFGLTFLITLIETLVLLTDPQSVVFALSKSYPAALILFWITAFYVFWAIKKYYREKDMLIQKNIDNQLLIKELQLEKKLYSSEKFATIGQLAAGLAHEIRNPLTAVLGFVQLLKNKDFCAKEKEYLDIIHEEMHRVNNLVGEFLLLAKPAAPLCKTHSAPAIVCEAVNLMQSEATLKEIGLVTESEEKGFIHVDKEQIKQVIINLIKNALEVTPQGKRVTLKVNQNAENNLCLIHVRDEGPGIPDTTIKKIFDPFFTTKADGTGLGLTVSFRIVENHGGRLIVQSTPGHGSIFTIELPTVKPSSGGVQ